MSTSTANDKTTLQRQLEREPSTMRRQILLKQLWRLPTTPSTRSRQPDRPLQPKREPALA